jgi:N-acetylmuramoyl-L-alanine amidase-like protein
LIASRALLRSVAVVRFRIWLTTALASGAIVGSLLHAQVGDEEKSPPKADESERIETHPASSPKPKKSPSPIAKASRDKSGKKHLASASPEKAPTAIPHAKLAKEESQTETDSSPKKKKSPTPIPKPKAAKEESTSEDSESLRPQESPRPRKAKPKSDDEEEATPRPTPRETPEPSASPKSKRHHTPTPKPKSAKKKSKEVSRKTKKAAKSKSARKEEEIPKPEKTPPAPAEERATVSERPSPVPKTIGVAAPTPGASPEQKVPRAPSGERAQVVIEKSGLEEDQGLEPPPSPPPRRGFWPWSRSSGNYRYLTRSVIEAIRRAPVKRRRWQFIVVHNSGTRQGNARVFDYYHRHVRRMQNGLAYHFVIGNGTSTGNGQVEVGDRWRRQINGGHVHSDYLNNISLGICLVGDFNRGQPTRAQLDACEELIRYLRDRCGKTDRGAIPVRPHREMNPPRWPTDCPGDDFPYSWFRRF